jgi:glucokinase
MNTEKNLAVGLDLGGTNTKYGLITPEGQILEQGRIKTADYPDVATFVDALYENIHPLIAKYNAEYQIRGVGIGAPNANFFTGNIEHAVNLHWKGTVPLAKMVKEKFNLPCVLNNDAKVAALGEHTFGVAQGMKDFIMITLGTGVGSGIFVNGDVLYGSKGNAGELGHTVIRYNGRKHWSTGLKGTVESYCSATGIVITAKEMLQEFKTESLLSQYKEEDLTSEAVYDCAMKGDQLALDVFKYTGEILGEALANFSLFSSPEAIVLFGGVMHAGDLILNPAKQSLEDHLIEAFKGQVKLLHSSLKLDDAAILGASRLV